MTCPFSQENISDIFGEDAADLEDPAKLYTFFLSNESYDETRAPNPIALIVGQKGIGKTALMLVSSLDDKRNSFPHIFITGSQILGAAKSGSDGSHTIAQFRGVIEDALVAEVVDQISKESATALGAPAKASNIVGTLARLGTTIVADQNEAVRKATQKLSPWLMKKISAINIYIDDTDVEWDGSRKAAEKISHLIQACFQLAARSGGDVRFKISIRSDLYNFLSVHSDLMDKIQSGIVKCRWTNDQIFRVLAKRLAIYEGRDFIDDEEEKLTQQQIFQSYFTPYFEERFRDTGAWKNSPMRQVLLSFVRQRPRDLIGLCRLAAKTAYKNKTKIDTAAIKSIVKTYCNNRLNDTVVEFRNELPEVEKLLYEMRSPERRRGKIEDKSIHKNKSNYYTHDELIAKVKNISDRINLRFSYQTMKPKPVDIVLFLYRINFLVASRKNEEGKTERMYYDFAEERLREVTLGRWDWEVHMAYRWAIQHDSDAIWAELEDV